MGHVTGKALILPLVLLLLTACGGGGGGSNTSQPPSATPDTGTSPPADEPLSSPPVDEQLEALNGLAFTPFIERSFDQLLRRYPESAVAVGAPEVPLALNDVSTAYEEDTLALAVGILDKLEAYSPAPGERHVFDIYRFYLEDLIEGAQYTDFSYPASYFLTSVPTDTLFFFTDIQPLESNEDAQAYLSRLKYVDRKIDQLMDLVDAAAANDIIMPRILLDASISAHRNVAETTAASNPYYSRLRSDMPAIGLGQAEQDALLADARNIITDEIIPAYSRLITQLQNQRAAAPSEIGVGQFPGGQDFYNFALRHHTTTGLTADEIHELGLQELDRIHGEMREIFDELDYPASGSIAENLARAAGDSGSVAPGEVVSGYEEILDEAGARLPEAFGVLPETELVVIGGPRGGFYVRPAIDGSRPGAFYAANTSSEPVFQMKSLAYHEGVPGHHLQIAIALEQAESVVQQYIKFTAFVEGWALYAERLAFELGWYQDDPLGNLGRLQYEALRATRLVVDTGIHARGWDFEQAVTYFQSATGFSRGASEGNIGRYSLWPGQSTAYMVGMLEILRFRDSLKTDPEFDLRSFHDKLLTRGAVPLTLLDF